MLNINGKFIPGPETWVVCDAAGTEVSDTQGATRAEAWAKFEAKQLPESFVMRCYARGRPA